MVEIQRPVGIKAVRRHPGIRFGWRENFSGGMLLWLAAMLAVVAWEATHETSRFCLMAWTALGTFMTIAWMAMAFVHLKDRPTDAD